MPFARFTIRCSIAIATTMPWLPVAAAPPAQRPFDTRLPWSLDRGRWEIAAGLLRRDDVSPPFTADNEGSRRSEWRANLVDATLGLGGGGEVRVQFGVQSFHEEGGAEGSGIDDARVSFGYQLPVEKLATSLRFEVKLPNAPDEEGLGTDETDVFILGAVGRLGRSGGWAGHAGLGILGSPEETSVQDDVLAYGVAGWYAPGGPEGRWEVLGEVAGQAASRLDNDRSIARAGVRIGRRCPVDISARRGLTSASERWGVETGVTFFLPFGVR